MRTRRDRENVTRVTRAVNVSNYRGARLLWLRIDARRYYFVVGWYKVGRYPAKRRICLFISKRSIGWRADAVAVVRYSLGRYMYSFRSTRQAAVLLKWDEDEGSARDMAIIIWRVSTAGLSVWGIGNTVSIHNSSTSVAYTEIHVQRWWFCLSYLTNCTSGSPRSNSSNAACGTSRTQIPTLRRCYNYYCKRLLSLPSVHRFMPAANR